MTTHDQESELLVHLPGFSNVLVRQWPPNLHIPHTWDVVKQPQSMKALPYCNHLSTRHHNTSGPYPSSYRARGRVFSGWVTNLSEG